MLHFSELEFQPGSESLELRELTVNISNRGQVKVRAYILRWGWGTNTQQYRLNL